MPRSSKSSYTGQPAIRRGTVRLRHDVARRLRAGHPFVFREALGRTVTAKPGEVAELVDWDGNFVARALYDGETAISYRLVSRNPGVEVGPALFKARVQAAVKLRERFVQAPSSECIRLVNGEADGIPAMTVDRYGDFIVAHLYSSLALSFAEHVYEALAEVVNPTGIYQQRRFRSLAGQGPKQGAELVHGVAAPVDFEVTEGDLKFWVDVTAPVSTGLFPDMRLGRLAVRRHAAGARVLNLFSYTGAFTVHAMAGGAVSATAVDIAPKAHARARRNLSLNGYDPEACEHIAGDALKVLAKMQERKRQFDLIVLDPPAFASASGGGKTWSAAKGYGELVTAALAVLAKGGLLAAACTTHRLSDADFLFAVAQGAADGRRRTRIIEHAQLPADFPTLPAYCEGNYLKFVMVAVD